MLTTGSEAVQISEVPSMPSQVILHKTGRAKVGICRPCPGLGRRSMEYGPGLFMAVSPGVPRPASGEGSAPGG